METRERGAVAFSTLGCRLNQYESDALATAFLAAGYHIAAPDEPAAVVVVNTCTVTGKGEQKSRHLARRARRAHPGALVVVIGCAVEEAGGDLRFEEGIDLVVGNREKHAVVGMVEALRDGRSAPLPHSDPFAFQAGVSPLHTRATLKIQDGCDNRCSYCIVPLVRGAAVSRAASAVLEEARRLIDAGLHELVLTGVNTASWQDGKQRLADLVASLATLPGDFRLRVSSLEPEGLVPELLALVADGRLCPHLHLALQSGSERVLAAMHRPPATDRLREAMADLRTRVPTLNLSADLICGFPGETEADFAETLRLAADLALSHVHAFTWSPRPGTPAAVMAGRIPERIRRERSTALRTAVAGQGKKFRDGMLGRTVRVLIERPGSGGLACGYSENYLPVAVRFPSPREAAAGRNTFVTLRVAGCGADGRLTGSLPSAVPDDPASAKNG